MAERGGLDSAKALTRNDFIHELLLEKPRR
jgi:hypothetical protein